MSFKLSSTKLLGNLEKVRSRFTGRRIDAVLTVSDEASWWYYHEFGTATHQGEGSFETPPTTVIQEPEGTLNTAGYPILPKSGKAIRLPGTSQHPEALLVPQVGAEFTVEHPGVPALGLVRTVLEDIHVRAASDIANSLHDGGYNPQTVQQDLLDHTMPQVLKIIVDSIDEKMGREVDRDTPGKLGGAAPAEVFRNAASIAIDAEE
jgi:hypothetical protein